jgi:hypothetical protein
MYCTASAIIETDKASYFMWPIAATPTGRRTFRKKAFLIAYHLSIWLFTTRARA